MDLAIPAGTVKTPIFYQGLVSLLFHGVKLSTLTIPGQA